MPPWTLPANLQELIDADEDGIWEDIRWEPILLIVSRGTFRAGREVDLSWQIEFEPYGEEFDLANMKMAELGIEPDGYGWATLLQTVFTKYHPQVADELEFGDTDADACVVWVESESTCRLLMQVAWTLIHDS